MAASDHACAHGDALADGAVDPTRTSTLRKRYSQKLRGRYSKVNAEIREGIVKRDVFGLRSDALQDRPIEDIPDLSYETDPRKHRGFMNWLRTQLRTGVLSLISRNSNRWLKTAYKSGLRHANTSLRKVDLGIGDVEMDVGIVFDMPVHRDAVAMLYTREYEDLKAINAEVAKQVSRELAEGFTKGHNPRKIARAIIDRVNKIGKTRAETMARTSIIDAHATATLNRFERVGVESVKVEAEWIATDDRRTCPVCHYIEDEIGVFTIEEARTETFYYEASGDERDSLTGEYPLKPPAHPRCRCSLAPVVDT